MIDTYFSSRTSVRNFQKREISNDVLYSIIKNAEHAPTCGNMQLYSVIITRDPENKKKLEALHYNQPAAVTADVILTVCADFHKFTKWCEINNAEAGFNNFHSFIMAATDAVIFAQQIVTIAEMEGYGTCYLGTVTYNAKEIAELLKLPKMVIPVASIALGVSQKDEPKVERLNVEGIVHEEFYPELDDNKIKEIYKIKEEFEPNQKYLKESGKKSLAAVFSEIRYPRKMNEKISKDFSSFINEQGFK